MLRVSFAIAFCALLLVCRTARSAEAPRLQYHRDIQPILSDTCFACHGPDAGQRQAGLRLDHREVAIAPADSGSIAIVPGKSAESELVARITSTDPDMRMPPEEGIKKLSPEQIALLKQWIDEGAEYQGHWSFMPIRKPVPPEVDRANGSSAAVGPKVVNAIDRFVTARLPGRGLAQSPPADPVTLARRVAIDLTGLPPTPARIAAFAADPSDANYEKLVDELLASPRFGERMAMWWLDLARYADSVGYHGDQSVSVFPFRDYVIRAFNQNMRFDRFTREQLGGDLLPNPTTDQKVAAGYNRLGMMTEEGGAQPKEYLAKYASERVRAIGGAWLGLTTGCSECHDHKFDPLTTREFYQFEAFFADITEKGVYGGNDYSPKLTVTTQEQDTQLSRFDGEIAALQKQLATATPELAAAQAVWEKSLMQKQVEWTPLKPLEAKSRAGTTLTVGEDSSVLAGGVNPPQDTYTIKLPAPAHAITAIRLEALPHDSLGAKGPGRAANGNFVLTSFAVSVVAADGTATPVPLANPSASFAQPGFPIEHAIDGAAGKQTGWGVYRKPGQVHEAFFETQTDQVVPVGGSLVIELAHNSEHATHNLGHFRISTTNAARPVKPAAMQSLPEPVRTILAVSPSERSADQNNQLAACYRTIAPLLQPARDQLAAVQKQRSDLEKSLPTMLATIARTPREIRVLPRGNWMDESGEIVQPAVPAFLPQPPAKEGHLNRLDLANWLVSKENPLVARVLVNRLWKICFGAGISPKVADLGAQGGYPSHPLLLDWLAADMIDSGWDIKRSLKQMVMSATYRQSSLVSPALREKDPFNHLLARQGRFRLDAEMIRDHALWISGLLVERVGGPSVKPYQPRGYWAYLNFPTREWQNSSGEDLYRRGLYTHWQRQYLHPSLLAFDAPTREECTVERVCSNTPLQALVLLNDPTYVEAARAFAELILHNGGASPAERLDYAFQRALSRPARPAEAKVLLPLLAEHLRQYRADTRAAGELLAVGAHPRASDLDPAELAAWTSVARAILNLHATITRN